jgi:hypothetical protein
VFDRQRHTDGPLNAPEPGRDGRCVRGCGSTGCVGYGPPLSWCFTVRPPHERYQSVMDFGCGEEHALLRTKHERIAAR